MPPTRPDGATSAGGPPGASAGPPPGPPRASRVVDVGVLVLGLLTGTLALAAWLAGGRDAALWPLLAVSLPLGCLLSRFPLSVTSRMTGVHVPFAPVLLAHLLTLGAPVTALLAWTLTVLPAYLTERRSWTSRVFNTGSSLLSAAAAAAAVAALRHDGAPDVVSVRALLDVLAACAVYYGVDFALSAVSVAVEERRRVREELRSPGTLLGGGLFLLMSTLAYLAAAVQSAMPGWVASLMLVPVLALVVAASSYRTANQRRLQQRELFRAAVEVHGAATRGQLREALRRHGSAVVSSGRLEVRAGPPGTAEQGVPVVGLGEPGEAGGPGGWWLVTGRSPVPDSERYDAAALESLGVLAEAALVRVALTQEAEHNARHDGLTGLPNRRSFTEHLAAAVDGGREVCVLFVDLDGFKAVNDTLGHAAGDELLAEAGRRLDRAVGHLGTPARLGGDEFAVVLREADLASAARIADAVVAALRVPYRLAAGTAVVGASVGCAAGGEADGADALLSHADDAMYAAKRDGGSRCVLAPAQPAR
ncbi:diguanylate cyclase domain-containing protein [Kineococcus sp. SYSU DK004]|uniref:diguanylate cyclase domain-containing protein n=1 Tax=Kineococcus sp. SYSU DK004 TaxID=3383125 RepID=UPI003D7D00FC